mgnify:CR=1 FL=1
MRVAIYARYSTDLQNPASIDDQIRVCSEFAHNNNYVIVNYFTDAAESGSSLNRFGIQSLLSNSSSFDVVICEAMDRLSRDQADIANIFKHLNFHDVKIITLSEGELSTMHIGLKGTMNAMFIADLAKKTHRGLRGRVEKGKSGGGNSYGYNVVKKFTHDGDLIRGDREINEEQAEVVRYVFGRYVNFSESPRTIAVNLNKQGIPCPSGSEWGTSTIQGNRRRGTGLLNNELYIGRMVWNRLTYNKHPVTGKRRSRINPESDWVVKEVPELQIIDNELWEAAKRKQLKLSVVDGNAKPVMRPKHLLSHLIVCDCCGAGFFLINKTRYGCSKARNKGTCNVKASIPKDALEKVVIRIFRDELVVEEVINAFISEYNKHLALLTSANNQQAKKNNKRIVDLEKQKRNIIESIKKGVPAELLRDDLMKIETNLQSFKNVIQLPKKEKVFPIGTAKRYIELIENLTVGDLNIEAFEFLRNMIEKITARLEGERMIVDLHINWLGFVPEKTRPATVGKSNLLVAGAGTTQALPNQIKDILNTRCG